MGSVSYAARCFRSPWRRGGRRRLSVSRTTAALGDVADSPAIGEAREMSAEPPSSRGAVELRDPPRQSPLGLGRAAVCHSARRTRSGGWRRGVPVAGVVCFVPRGRRALAAPRRFTGRTRRRRAKLGMATSQKRSYGALGEGLRALRQVTPLRIRPRKTPFNVYSRERSD